MNLCRILFLATTAIVMGIYIVSMTSCADDQTGIFDGFITFEGENLLPIDDQVYKLWLYDEDGSSPFTFVGDLTPDINGLVPSTRFDDIDQSASDNANALVVSMEEDTVLAEPRGTILIGGDFSGRSVDTMTIAYPIAIQDPLRAVGGEFDLISPSTLDPVDTLSGVWFYDTTRVDTTLLNLPELHESWTYESWVDFGGDIVLSMGRFRSVDQADSSSIYSGPEPTFDFPGEDFINNLPMGLDTPVDVTGTTVFISVEPVNDFNREEPFYIIPLSIEVPLMDGTIALSPEGIVRPTGKGSR